MFTGLVTMSERSCRSRATTALRRIRIASHYDPASIALGASIACSGPCLTVVAVGPAAGGCWFEVDAAAETLARTARRARGARARRLNLERSLKIGDELGGHIVTGHVDGLAEIVAREAVTGGAAIRNGRRRDRFTLRAPAPLRASSPRRARSASTAPR